MRGTCGDMPLHVVEIMQSCGGPGRVATTGSERPSRRTATHTPSHEARSSRNRPAAGSSRLTRPKQSRPEQSRPTRAKKPRPAQAPPDPTRTQPGLTGKCGGMAHLGQWPLVAQPQPQLEGGRLSPEVMAQDAQRSRARIWGLTQRRELLRGPRGGGNATPSEVPPRPSGGWTN